MIKIAVLYRKTTETDKKYPYDYMGRGTSRHVQRVHNILQAKGYASSIVELDMDSYERLKNENYDLVFNLCDDGFRDDPLLEAHIPALLDILAVPYTGSGVLTLATCVNKARTKEVLAYHRIMTPAFQLFYRDDEPLNPELQFPLIVKPNHEDASIGIRRESVVKDDNELRQQIYVVHSNYQQPALVEQFINGREVYVGILGAWENLTILPLTEVMFDQNLKQDARICTYESKWMAQSEQYKNTTVQCPALLDKELQEKVVAIAKEAYKIFYCRDYSRIDFRIDEKGQPFILEINPNPDISEDAGVARMAKAAGINYEELVERIAVSALERSQLLQVKKR
ncbi:MAG: ATP-grasp domain-containing protein [Candidatus Omnitrophota bacterium]